MPNEKQPQKEQIKVTDKRIFTADGEIREEFREQIRPSDPAVSRPVEPPPVPKAAEPKPAASQSRPPQEQQERRAPGAGDRRRTLADNPDPGTAFAGFVQSLAMQAYMSLGMLPNPYQPQARPDPGAARQLIDILAMLQEKTAGNLNPEEEEFLSTLLGELKLNFVKITKNLT